MDPTIIANLALGAINAALAIINHLRGSGALTPEQLSDLADKQDSANADKLKQLMGV